MQAPARHVELVRCREAPIDALLRLQPHVDNVRAARHFVADALTDGADLPDLDVVVLLTSEVVTNAVVHGGPHPPGADLLVRLQRQKGRVRLEVEDHNQDGPTVRRPGLQAEGGRGMLLVDTLADKWGVAPAPGGKAVWFEVGSPDR